MNCFMTRPYLRQAVLAGLMTWLWLIGACGQVGVPTSGGESALTPAVQLASPSPRALAIASLPPTVAPWPTPPAAQASTLRASPSPPPSPSPPSPPLPTTCSAKSGRIELDRLDSTVLGSSLEYRIYLPPCYDTLAYKSYPVLYLLHGQGFSDDQWERLGAGKVADALITSGETAPFLIVMPRDRIWLEPASDPFGEALVGELIPLVDSHYRTRAERRYRAVGGLSRGGAWAVHLGLQNWPLFTSIGVHSGFVFHSDVPHVKTWLAAIPAEQMPRIYLDLGNSDEREIAQSAAWFEQLLTQNAVPHEWHLFVGFHDETYWQGHVEDYLRWYAQDW